MNCINETTTTTKSDKGGGIKSSPRSSISSSLSGTSEESFQESVSPNARVITGPGSTIVSSHTTKTPTTATNGLSSAAVIDAKVASIDEILELQRNQRDLKEQEIITSDIINQENETIKDAFMKNKMFIPDRLKISEISESDIDHENDHEDDRERDQKHANDDHANDDQNKKRNNDTNNTANDDSNKGTRMSSERTA
ncbi:unnamed protein product [[Candida] boidinii]|uniref:Unnamed protein product n=1 Tax=Candida boidinii TaxID=5477 RepID=A0A9W6WI90_CANBO|nr:unnamed protein product [[Candida] boidinii]GMG18384.1 unnamed protein product [[Candida] boidinii]